MKKLIAAQVLLTTVLLGLNFMPSASATSEDPHKAYVCKFVGKPGVDETLQTGNNPIEVDTNALEGKGFAGTFPFEFSDAQGRSVAIGFVGDGFPVLTIANCPAPQGPPPPPTTTQPPPPPPTTTAPPPPPPTTTQPPPPPTTTTVPPVTTTTVVTVPPNPNPVPCKGSVALGPWYGDPRINITLTGSGHFVVTGGIQRTTNTTTFDVNLACGQVLKIGRYKVERGHYLTITQDSVLVTHIKPPRLR